MARLINVVTGAGSERSVGLAREVSQGVMLLALAGASVGGLLGMVAIATRALGG
ncbi:MAG: hypothetical protein ACRDK3_14180 [Actinomycetota bacterium]